MKACVPDLAMVPRLSMSSCAAHADAVVGDREGLGCLVGGDA